MSSLSELTVLVVISLVVVLLVLALLGSGLLLWKLVGSPRRADRGRYAATPPQRRF